MLHLFFITCLMFLSLPLYAYEPSQTCTVPSLQPKVSQRSSVPLSSCVEVKKQKIAVFDTPKNHSHSQKVIEKIKRGWGDCRICEVELFAIYNNKGELLLNDFLYALKKIDNSYRVINLSWNLPFEEKYFAIVQELNRITDLGVVLVAASGIETGSKPVINIDQTVMGQVKSAILVGELINGKLTNKAYYGEKISIALPEDQKYKGSSFLAAEISGRILNSIVNGRNYASWAEHFRLVKKNSQRMWPSIEDYFKSQQ